MRCYAVYHVMSQLSQRGKLIRIKIDAQGDPLINLRDDELERYADRSAYGCFYRVPYNLKRGQSAAVSANAICVPPSEKRRDSCYVLSVYRLYGYRAATARRLEAVPASGGVLAPIAYRRMDRDEVVTQDGYEVSTYRMAEPLLPYQGLRIAWHYR